MVLLVRGAHTLQDEDGVLDVRLFHLHRLEAPLEGRVAFDVLAVLVERGRADRLDLASGEGRLQDVRRVHGALGRAGTDEHVELVDEQHAVAGGLDLFDDLLQALFELTAVLRAGDKQADVQREHALADEGVRDVARDDAVGKALRDRGLADTGLADEHGVVLGAAREDLDDPLDLAVAAHDRVQLAGARHRGEVYAELVQGGGPDGASARSRGLPGGLAALRLGLREDPLRLRTDSLQVHAEALEHASGDAFTLADEAEEQVLRADVRVLQPARLVDGQLNHLLGARGQADFTGGLAVATADDELDGRAHLVEFHTEVGKDLRGHTITLAYEAQEQVLRADVRVVEALRFLLSEGQDTTRTLRELIEPVGHQLAPFAYLEPLTSDIRPSQGDL